VGAVAFEKSHCEIFAIDSNLTIIKNASKSVISFIHCNMGRIYHGSGNNPSMPALKLRNTLAFVGFRTSSGWIL
jgi:hypothetical protein